jgi:hypothetical protein
MRKDAGGCGAVASSQIHFTRACLSSGVILCDLDPHHLRFKRSFPSGGRRKNILYARDDLVSGSSGVAAAA